VIRTVEEEAEMRAQQDAVDRKLAEDREKIELIERLETRPTPQDPSYSEPYYERYKTGVQSVRHYHPDQPSRFRRLRALSDLLLFAAYLEIAIALVLAGILIALKASGDLSSTVLFVVALCGTLAVGVFGFFSLKFFGEVAFLLADIGDQQSDVVRLMLDVRSNTDEADVATPR
jgi:hypothetical protein